MRSVSDLTSKLNEITLRTFASFLDCVNTFAIGLLVITGTLIQDYADFMSDLRKCNNF